MHLRVCHRQDYGDRAREVLCGAAEPNEELAEGKFDDFGYVEGEGEGGRGSLPLRAFLFLS